MVSQIRREGTSNGGLELEHNNRRTVCSASEVSVTRNAIIERHPQREVFVKICIRREVPVLPYCGHAYGTYGVRYCTV